METRYRNARKIVEVGVGRKYEVAARLASNLTAELILTDLNPNFFVGVRLGRNVKMIVDDIFNPDWKLYEGADLIYAIRPNPEVQNQILEVASRVGADVLLNVLSGEWIETNNKKMKHVLINYKGVTLHLFLNVSRKREET
ncbi:MAG: UPF0146 family protein [Candidatus Jordarchaeales archaeon]